VHGARLLDNGAISPLLSDPGHSPSTGYGSAQKARPGAELLAVGVFRPLAWPVVRLFAWLRVPPPAVVLLHGFASSIYTWKDVLPGLARTRTVLALDFPGFGESDQPPDLGFAVLPKVVRGLMDTLGLGSVTLVGNSLGGAVATVLAVESPERIDALVLIDAAGFNLNPSDRPAILRFAASPAGAAVFERLPIRGRMLRLGLRQVFFDPALVTAERFNEYLAPLLRPGAPASAVSLLTSRALTPASTWSPSSATSDRIRVASSVGSGGPGATRRPSPAAWWSSRLGSAITFPPTRARASGSASPSI
jgi:pimeloyl-ACP methyl ester carboxylesterase